MGGAGKNTGHGGEGPLEMGGGRREEAGGRKEEEEGGENPGHLLQLDTALLPGACAPRLAPSLPLETCPLLTFC